MAKRRIKKRTVSRKKQSFLGKILSLPKALLGVFVILAVVGAYQMATLPARNVLGVSTSQYKVLSQTQVKSALSSSDAKNWYFIGVNIFVDLDNNALKHPLETCYQGSFTSIANGTNSPLVASSGKCQTVYDAPYILSKQKCNTVSLGTASLYDSSTGTYGNYKVTGLNYFDGSTKGKIKVEKGKTQIKVCGGKIGYADTLINFGIKEKPRSSSTPTREVTPLPSKTR